MVVKLQKKGAGAPGREPVVSEDEQKAMIAFYHKKEQARAAAVPQHAACRNAAACLMPHASCLTLAPPLTLEPPLAMVGRRCSA